MYSQDEFDFLNYLDQNQSSPNAKYLADSAPMSTLEKIRGQSIYFVRVFLTLILIQFVSRSVFSIIATISKTTKATQFDGLGNPVAIEVTKETWIAFQTFEVLKKYFHVLNL